MRPTDVTEVDVYRGSVRVGHLLRTKTGSEFRYDGSFVGEAANDVGVAFSIPPSRRQIVTRGVNLHPFFAGLLPEGLRLTALTTGIKTSPDDLLSLLVAVGAECIGDIAVVPRGEPLLSHQGLVDVAKPAELSFDALLKSSIDSAGADMSIPGVQEKVSGSMISIPVSARKAAAAYILKLNPPNRPKLVENEAFFLRMAGACGLDAAKARLIHDGKGRAGLLVTRFDRVFEKGNSVPRKIHQEDGCQILGRYPADKYRITCQEITDAIAEWTTAPAVQILRFLELQAFSYLIGNGDLHAKNVSLRVSPATGLIELTPAYDLLTTHAYRGLDQRMAMKLGAKDDELRALDFIGFGTRNGLREPAIRKMLDRLVRRAEPWLDRLEDVGWETRDRDRVARCLASRLKRLR